MLQRDRDRNTSLQNVIKIPTSLTKTQCFTSDYQEIKFIFIKQRWPHLKDIITEILSLVKMPE